MSKLRFDHVSIVVKDLAAASRFFEELGLEVEGKAEISGEWVDRISGVPGIDCEIWMMKTPDGAARIEFTRFLSPNTADSDTDASSISALGLRSVMFEVEDIADMARRLAAAGGELMGEIVQYENAYKLCYVRGPEGVIVALAESL